MIDLKTGEMTFNLRWVAWFVGSPHYLIQRWVLRGWLTCTGGGVAGEARYFNLRQVRQAYVLGLLLRGNSATNASGWMTGTQLRGILKSMPNPPANEPMWLLVIRKNGTCFARWLTESELEDVHGVGLSGGSSLLGIPSVYGV
jgi:hypothetical protein